MRKFSAKTIIIIEGIFSLYNIQIRDLIDIKIAYQNGIFEIILPKERVTNSSARIFALWITLPAYLLIFIAILEK